MFLWQGQLYKAEKIVHRQYFSFLFVLPPCREFMYKILEWNRIGLKILFIEFHCSIRPPGYIYIVKFIDRLALDLVSVLLKKKKNILILQQ